MAGFKLQTVHLLSELASNELMHELLNCSGLLGLTLGGGFLTADWTIGGPRLESCILIGQ